MRITGDGLLYAVDLSMVVTGKNRDDAGKAIRNISDETFQSANFTERQISSHGGHKTKLVSFEHAIELIMVLPGKVAKETRAKFANIIRRYLAGDKSLIVEINANAASNSPIAQLARVSLDAPVLDEVTKKRQLEREDALFEIEMAERRQRLVHLTMETNVKAAEVQVKVMDVQRMLMDTYTSLCPNRIIDERARLMFKDNFLNLASPASYQLAIENGGVGSRPFTVSDVAASMKLHFNRGDTQKLGKLAAASYREKYGQEPSKHEQWVDGATRSVNSYEEKDRAMVENVIKSFVKA